MARASVVHDTADPTPKSRQDNLWKAIEAVPSVRSAGFNAIVRAARSMPFVYDSVNSLEILQGNSGGFGDCAGSVPQTACAVALRSNPCGQNDPRRVHRLSGASPNALAGTGGERQVLERVHRPGDRSIGRSQTPFSPNGYVSPTREQRSLPSGSQERESPNRRSPHHRDRSNSTLELLAGVSGRGRPRERHQSSPGSDYVSDSDVEAVNLGHFLSRLGSAAAGADPGAQFARNVLKRQSTSRSRASGRVAPKRQRPPPGRCVYIDDEAQASDADDDDESELDVAPDSQKEDCDGFIASDTSVAEEDDGEIHPGMFATQRDPGDEFSPGSERLLREFRKSIKERPLALKRAPSVKDVARKKRASSSSAE